MALKLPKVIGHRGCAAYAPENTLVGIHTAADMDIEWVEIDVMLTKDCVAVIFHDDTLERTTNGSGNIAEITYKELQQLDCGSWKGDSFIDTKIPTLEEAIEVIIERDLGLNLEIKGTSEREGETAEIALDMLSQYWDEDDNDKLLISSFSYDSLEVAHDMATQWHRGLLLGNKWPENWKELAQYLDVATINIDGNTCTHTQVQELKELGKIIIAYTINEPERAQFLQNWGVDCFFSDEPDVIQEALCEPTIYSVPNAP